MSIIQATGITVCRFATPTISTSPAYTSGDQVGGIIELTNVFRRFYRPYENLPSTDSSVVSQAGKATLKSAGVVDISLQNSNFDFWFFNEIPTVASSDNGALNITDSEILKLQHVLGFSATYSTTTQNSSASASGIELVITQSPTATSDSLWVVAQTKSTPTYTTTTALRFKFDFFLD